MVISLKDYLDQAPLRDERYKVIEQWLSENPLQQDFDIQAWKITQSTRGWCNTLLENI